MHNALQNKYIGLHLHASSITYSLLIPSVPRLCSLDDRQGVHDAAPSKVIFLYFESTRRNNMEQMYLDSDWYLCQCACSL